VIEYLQEENRMTKERLGGRPISSRRIVRGHLCQPLLTLSRYAPP
jgi:hypothetical protein